MNPALDSNVDDDRRCIECDYALRGLPAEGRCPECGSPYDEGTIIVESAIGIDNHPAVLVPVCLGSALVAWWSATSFVAIIPALIAVGLLVQVALGLQKHGRITTQERCVFARAGLTLRKSMGTTTMIAWHEVGYCSLSRAWIVQWRRTRLHRSYRLRLSRSRRPFLWSGFMVDTWFDATQEQVEAIAQMIRASLRVDARSRIRIEPEPQRDGTSFGQFR